MFTHQVCEVASCFCREPVSIRLDEISLGDYSQSSSAGRQLSYLSRTLIQNMSVNLADKRCTGSTDEDFSDLVFWDAAWWIVWSHLELVTITRSTGEKASIYLRESSQINAFILPLYDTLCLAALRHTFSSHIDFAWKRLYYTFLSLSLCLTDDLFSGSVPVLSCVASHNPRLLAFGSSLTSSVRLNRLTALFRRQTIAPVAT